MSKKNYPRIQTVIISKIPLGSGTVRSPFRHMTRVHSLKGKFIAEFDPDKPNVPRQAQEVIE